MKNSGLFLNMAKGCFFACFVFQALMSLCFLSGIVPEVLKMLVFFPSFFGLLWGGLFLSILGLEGLGVFVFLVFAFLFFCIAFVSVCLLCFVLWLDVVVSVSVFFLCFCFCCFFLFVFFCFCFFGGGFKGQVRWPKGPPHLALNPRYFLFVCLFVCFCFCFCFFCFRCFVVNRKIVSLPPPPPPP